MLYNDRQTQENLERVRGRLLRMMRKKMEQKALAQSGKKQQGGSSSSEQGRGKRSPGQSGTPRRQVSQNKQMQSLQGVSGSREQSREPEAQKGDASGKKPGLQTVGVQGGEEANLSLMGTLEAAKWYRRLEKVREGHLYKITPETARRSEENANPW